MSTQAELAVKVPAAKLPWDSTVILSVVVVITDLDMLVKRSSTLEPFTMEGDTVPVKLTVSGEAKSGGVRVNEFRLRALTTHLTSKPSVPAGTVFL